MKHFPYGRSRGFTIVELLIVIVVIGILSTILFLSYNNVQANAKTQSAQANATVLQRKIESYMSIRNTYPDANNATDYTTALNSLSDSSIASAKLAIATAPLDGNTPVSTLEVSQCSTGSNGSFYRIRYYDYSKRAIGTNEVTGSLGTSTCSGWTVLQ